ncbi:MAG: cytochrome c-type biogenesis protein CcmH [Desulfobacterales bacterium]|nr:cytochrome c-type biogenesis protein CcmH [Desulfobacterales bacterium]
MRHKISIVGLTLFILLFPVHPVFSSTGPIDEEALQKTARGLYDRIMCPICNGQTIAQSNSETSVQMRDLVLKKLRQGQSKEEILQYFMSRYGERIIAEPPKKGFNLMLWFLPFIVVALAAVVIWLMIRRWSTRGVARTAPGIDEAQLDEYKERLEKELKEFDQA